MRKNKVAKNVKEFLLDLIFMTVGSVIYAVGLNGFTAPNNIAPGGVSGIAIVLNYLFGTPVGTVILLINVPIIIWAIIEIGYKLVTKTMLAVVLNAACIDIVALFMPVYHGDPLMHCGRNARINVNFCLFLRHKNLTKQLFLICFLF